jgi:hypothetical protein
MPTDADRELAAFYRQAIADREKHMTQEVLSLLSDGSEAARKWAGLPPSLAGGFKVLDALEGKIQVKPSDLRAGRQSLEKLKVHLLHYQAAAAPRTHAIPRNKPGQFKALFEAMASKAPAAAELARPHGLTIDMDVPYPQTTPVKPSPGQCTLAWSDEALYMYFQLADQTPASQPRERDGAVYDDDCVELFIVTQNDPIKYWELNINRDGSIRDVTVEKQPGIWFGTLDDKATLPGLKSVVKTDTDGKGYAVVVRVPWADLLGPGVKPKTGDRFKFVVGFSDTVKNPAPGVRGQTYYSNIYTYVGYHDVWRYETMELVD